MNRRHFLTTNLSLGTATLFFTPRSTKAAGQPSALVTTPLTIMAPTTEGFDAIWGVSRLSKGKITCQAEDGSRTEIMTDSFGFVPQGDKVIKVRVRGLKPGTAYRVKAITTAGNDGEEHQSEEWQTRTLDEKATSTEFVVWNDTHVNNQTIQMLHDRTPAGDFFVWNGDTCNDWKSPDLLQPTLLNPGGRGITQSRPLCLTWGNHDVRGPHAYQMSDLVSTPSGRPFYAVRSGPVAAVFLHTGEDKPDSHPSFGGRAAFDLLRREQAAWLETILAEPKFRDAPYRLVFCHIPLRWKDERPQDYANGGFDRFSGRSRELWHKALVKWKTQLIISGHTHQQTWLPPVEEYPYGQLIGGGTQPTSATWMHGRFTEKEGVIEARNLAGEILQEVKLKAL